MKINFELRDDGQVHTYCMVCHNETVELRWVKDEDEDEDEENLLIKMYYCNTCNKLYERRIVIYPTMIHWVADDGELWHKSVGVFVRNADKKFLFYTRKKFPRLRTVPSGHVDKGETPNAAAGRELKEEVYLEGHLIPIGTEKIMGDSCSTGSDAHEWHVFLLIVDDPPPIQVDPEEGYDPVWLTLDDAIKGQLAYPELTYPVKYIIQRYGDELKNKNER